ncbi:ATP-binding cassette domain-containing protein [Microbacterium sp. RD1]|uniref:ABC transporter ATP-binding protein n=1 Tax=Microbacterium sp. RD1 TaxID=3457313 RepID=UPI003FA5302A
MTASLPLPENLPPDSDGEGTSSAESTAPPTPRRTPARKAPAKKPPAAPKTAEDAAPASADTPKPSSPRTSTSKSTAARKPAATKTTAARTPATTKTTASKSTAAKSSAAKATTPRATGAKTASAPAGAKKPAPRPSAAKRPAAPRATAAAPAAANAPANADVVSAPAAPPVPPPPPLPDHILIPPLPPLPPLPATASSTGDAVATDEPAHPGNEPAASADAAGEPEALVGTDPEVPSIVETDSEVPPVETESEITPDVETEAGIDAGVEPAREITPDVETEAGIDALVATAPGIGTPAHDGPVEEVPAVIVADSRAEPEAEPEQLEVEPEAVALGESGRPTREPLGTEPEPAHPREAAPVLVPADAPEDAAAPIGASDVPALALTGVAKSFGATVAVDGVDLSVPAGSFYGIVGPNGAGKTTTLSMIAGLLRADSGSIAVNGIDVRADPARAKRAMGVLPDRLRTFDRLTGRQLLYYYGVLRGLSSAVVESRISDLARAFDLVEALGRPVSDYSAGMTKKVMLAGAMIHSPRLLVLDEPFESVDPVSSAVILDILGTYVQHGGTVILSSHGMELVERVCTRVAVLVAGQVLAEGTVDEVRGAGTLQERFLELAGGLGDVEGLEWLHTFSD